MEFAAEMVLPSPPERLWSALTDVRLAAACVPGCEEIEEIRPLERYRAVIRRRVGPFKVEVPIDIVMENVEVGGSLRAAATGRDRITGTSVSASLRLSLDRAADAATRLAVSASIQVSGRLASLGFSMIRAQTQEAFDEFGERLRLRLAAL